MLFLVTVLILIATVVANNTTTLTQNTTFLSTTDQHTTSDPITSTSVEATTIFVESSTTLSNTSTTVVEEVNTTFLQATMTTEGDNNKIETSEGVNVTSVLQSTTSLSSTVGNKTIESTASGLCLSASWALILSLITQLIV